MELCALCGVVQVASHIVCPVYFVFLFCILLAIIIMIKQVKYVSVKMHRRMSLAVSEAGKHQFYILKASDLAGSTVQSILKNKDKI